MSIRRRGLWAVSSGFLVAAAVAAQADFFVSSIEVAAGRQVRSDQVVEIELDFGEWMRQASTRREFSPASLRLIEEGPGGGSELPFQFDPQTVAGAPAGRGTLCFLLRGRLAAGTKRRLRLFFGGAPASSGPPVRQLLVRWEQAGTYQGDETFRIVTPRATYYYHVHGSGFASMFDGEGNDWISYRPQGGPKGLYRGIPNIAPAGFHPGPGEGNKPSRILDAGPLRVRIYSETKDERWAVLWDIYPWHATMTVLREGPEPYWILYEETPGGEFDLSDYWVDSSGRRFEMAPYQGVQNAWHGDLPDPEWVYFGDSKLGRVLFLALHEKDSNIDEFWHLGEGGMTVFGFGRGPKQEGWQRLPRVPARFSMGFVESTRFAEVRRAVEQILRPPTVKLGKPRRVR
ncbi:MAG: hypothetical protein ACP5U2_14385 [Bryobacteraceae bacterium]